MKLIVSLDKLSSSKKTIPRGNQPNYDGKRVMTGILKSQGYNRSVCECTNHFPLLMVEGQCSRTYHVSCRYVGSCYNVKPSEPPARTYDLQIWHPPCTRNSQFNIVSSVRFSEPYKYQEIDRATHTGKINRKGRLSLPATINFNEHRSSHNCFKQHP